MKTATGNSLISGRVQNLEQKIKTDMEEVFSFLATHKDVAFATVEGNKPKVRVFQIMKTDHDSLYFATSARKEVYRQLQQNPFVELLAMEGNLSVRIMGEARFDVPDDVQQEIYRSNEILQRLYSDYAAMVYFRLAIREADYYDLTPTPPLLKHYTF